MQQQYSGSFVSSDLGPGVVPGAQGAAGPVLWQRRCWGAARVPAPVAVAALREHAGPAGLAGGAGDEHPEERVPAAGDAAHRDPGRGRVSSQADGPDGDWVRPARRRCRGPDGRGNESRLELCGESLGECGRAALSNVHVSSTVFSSK